MSSRKIIYLINPISGTGGKFSLQEMIRQKTGEKGIAYSILPTNAEGDYAFLLPFIEQTAVTDIIVCGGDGTVSAVAAALAGVDVRIGIVPMGSGNGLAFAAGIPKDVERALEIIFTANASPIDGFLINGQFSCMLCGIGFDAKVAEEFASQTKRGFRTYVRVTLKNFFNARPYPFRLRIPSGNGQDASFGEEAFFISIANGNQFGNNFTIAPKASLHDGLLDIVIAKKTNQLRFLVSVIRQVMGGYRVLAKPEAESGARIKIIYFQTPALVIENPGHAPLHIDGDPKASASEFHISVVPKAIQLIQP
ncbi:diacylglycerol/lipid kinase family protein [Puia dinghuensis]|nr:YegS/Rv2252/BmrU family lipid kinase [Puia dinghuensis]